jgi:hypothetical protein
MVDFIIKSLKWFLLLVISQVAIVIFLVGVFDKVNIRSFILTKNHDNKNGMVYILGNSHPECAINDSLLPKNYANIAQSAEPMFYSVIKARRLLANGYKIDTIIMEFTNNSLNTVKWVVSDSRLMRNYKKYFAVMNLGEHAFVFNNNPIKSLKTFFSITPFELFSNTKNVDGAYLYLIKNKIEGFDKSINVASDDSASEVFNDIHDQENCGIVNLLSLIKGHPRTFFIITRMPMHKSYKGLGNEKRFQYFVKQLNENRNCRFIDFLKSNLNDEDYADDEHLNYKGARKFTPVFRDSVISVSSR